MIEEHLSSKKCSPPQRHRRIRSTDDAEGHALLLYITILIISGHIGSFMSKVMFHSLLKGY